MFFEMWKNTACSKTVPLRNTTMVSNLSVSDTLLPNLGQIHLDEHGSNAEWTLQWQKRQVLRREENRPILHLFHLCGDVRIVWHRSCMELFHWKQLLAALRYHFQRSWKWINPKAFKGLAASPSCTLVESGHWPTKTSQFQTKPERARFCLSCSICTKGSSNRRICASHRRLRQKTGMVKNSILHPSLYLSVFSCFIIFHHLSSSIDSYLYLYIMSSFYFDLICVIPASAKRALASCIAPRPLVESSSTKLPSPSGSWSKSLRERRNRFSLASTRPCQQKPCTMYSQNLWNLVTSSPLWLLWLVISLYYRPPRA